MTVEYHCETRHCPHKGLKLYQVNCVNCDDPRCDKEPRTYCVGCLATNFRLLFMIHTGASTSQAVEQEKSDDRRN